MILGSFVGALVVCPGSGAAASAASIDDLSFLVGRWAATGGGSPGQASGVSEFERALQGHALVRRSFAEYPATSTAPASRHDDLMVVFPGADGALGADYYDTEGHHIHYAVGVPSPGSAVFVSDSIAGAPRFRLSYRLDPSGHLRGTFEIAPPGSPDRFGPYLSWDSVRADSTAPASKP